VKYVSTRGQAPVLDFEGALLSGLARDGGLYVPETWPRLDADAIAGFAGRPYGEVAVEVMKPFVAASPAAADFETMVQAAYGAFDDRAVAPVRPLGAGEYLVELFHGPTLAFKDVAMQLLGRLMDHVLARRGERVTIVGATSGDTGGAAIEAFAGRAACDVFILHPHGRVTDVQRRQMTTVGDENIHNIAIEGTFDDCQALVKAMFGDHGFRDRIRLAGVNSVNWARVMAQTVYYFTTAAAVAANQGPGPVDFVVPTGNFGDIFAGYVASRMGLDTGWLIIATNVNDILARTLETGRYEPREVIATASPSMDIQVSSNFERLLFDAYDRDAPAVRALMDRFAKERMFEIAPEPLRRIRAEFAAGSADEDETAAEIRSVHDAYGLLIDPHTAVGVHVARKLKDPERAIAILATAHPAKFPDAVERACGVRPGLPAHLADLFEREERYTVLPDDLAAVQSFIGDRALAA